jgi:hypothetical protein
MRQQIKGMIVIITQHALSFMLGTVAPLTIISRMILH